MADDDDLGMEFPHEPLPLPVGEVYTRGGERVTEDVEDAWAAEFAQRWVAYSELRLPPHGERVVLSTVFLGVDASLGLAPRPLLYESAVHGGHLDRHVIRYPAEPDARVGHVELLARIVLDVNGGTIPGRGVGRRAAPEQDWLPEAAEPEQNVPERGRSNFQPATQPLDVQQQPPVPPVEPQDEPNDTLDGLDDPVAGQSRTEPLDEDDVPSVAPIAHRFVDPAAPTTGPIRSVAIPAGAAVLPDFPPMSQEDDE